MQRVPGWPSLVGNPQFNALATQLPHQLADGSRILGDSAVAARRTFLFGNDHRDRRAVHSKPMYRQRRYCIIFPGPLPRVRTSSSMMS
jgi:hypothetical protein